VFDFISSEFTNIMLAWNWSKLILKKYVQLNQTSFNKPELSG